MIIYSFKNNYVTNPLGDLIFRFSTVIIRLTPGLVTCKLTNNTYTKYTCPRGLHIVMSMCKLHTYYLVIFCTTTVENNNNNVRQYNEIEENYNNIKSMWIFFVCYILSITSTKRSTKSYDVRIQKSMRARYPPKQIEITLTVFD